MTPPPSSRRRGLLSAVLALTAVPALAAPSAPPPPAPETLESVQTLPIEEIRRGQKGYGLSVFAGQELERFEVEILGVLRNSSPDVSYILARLSGQGLETSGVIAGMSGSPVFVDGRLVGAVSFSWPFAKEPIAGITPIAAMRDLAGAGSGVAARPAATVDLDDLLDPERDSTAVLAEEIARLRPPVGGSQAAAAIGWGLAGFGPVTESLFARPLGATSSAGEMLPTDEPPRVERGSAVAAVLVDGDLRLAATGTVTDRRGDEVLAFGHPFLGLGEIEVPMAEAEVVTVFSSQYNSFKLANFGRVVGAFETDRLPGIRGRLGARAATIPLTVSVSNPEPRRYEMRLARIPQLAPMLTAISVLGAQEASAKTTGPLGLDLTARFDLGPQGKLELAQTFDGDNAPTDAAVYLLTFTHFLLQNSWAEVDLHGIEVDVAHHPTPRTAVLVGGYADRTEVRPGERVKLHLDLMPFRGEPVRHDLTVDLPPDLPAGRYSLLVGDGVSLDGARQKIEQAPPVTFDQVMRYLSRFHSRRDLVVLGVHAGNGLSVGGEVLSRLPGSMQSVWTAAGSQSAAPLRLAIAQERTERLEVPIEGAVRIDLQVRRRQPLTAEGAADGSGSGGEEESTTSGAASEESPAPATVPASGSEPVGQPRES